MARKPKQIRHLKLNPNGTALYGQYKKRAKKKKLTFDLTKDEFLKLTQEDCYICGTPPTQRYIHRYALASYVANPFTYNGIDRVENDGGYEMGNVLACCGTCNLAKKGQSLHDFLQYINRCYKFALKPFLRRKRKN